MENELFDDWAQANWEILVESKLCNTPRELLEAYGDGADCNVSSSRVWCPQGKPTHRVSCIAKVGNFVTDILTNSKIDTEKFSFVEFVGWTGNKFGRFHPFDYVLLESNSDQHLVRADEVVFTLKKLV
ncbi:MAG: hypothetical protein CSA81_05315 [Acidobacteria bacterium]|nr:MAG: hypothetical protein CSA81_05315 [Acidobacteriota bacterium]PIE90993.1 MAG: hypothetical protein CR997_03795 [Acidobacteriota bacterium]